MAAQPLVTVVTPTWDRDSFLLRAIMSVALQDYRPIQHVVVSDGPNPALARLLKPIAGEHADSGYELSVAYLDEHRPARWGHFARLHGTGIAKGDYIAYLDDDDELLPGHVRRLMNQLSAPDGERGFAYSQILIHEPGGTYVSGSEPPSYGQISTSSILHRKEILSVATWRDEGQYTVDWDLAERWVKAGVSYAFLPVVTSVAHRDAPNVSSDRPRTC